MADLNVIGIAVNLYRACASLRFVFCGQSSAMLAILVVVGANRVNHVNFVEFLPRTMQI
jgi:hypothetical protein